MEPSASGYAPVGELELYWESYGKGEIPLILVHGGYGTISMAASVIAGLAAGRRVIAVELQGHGHTRDIDRAFTYEAFGDDVGAIIEHLGLGQADVLGYSLGASVALRTAIQHPARVRRLVAVSAPCRRDGWFPEVRAVFDQMGSAGLAFLQRSPLYEAYVRVAPDPAGFPALMDKTGELQRVPYDWSEEVRGLELETMLVYADADSISTAHIAEFYGLLGGGLEDARWDGSARSRARLAILPGYTHYDVFDAPELVSAVQRFLR